MDWCAEYLHIPYVDRGRDWNGCDCWGLVRLVLAEQFGKSLPSLDAYEAVDPEVSARLINEALPAVDSARVDSPEAGDVAIMKIRGEPAHVGIFVSPAYVLHTMRDRGPALDRLSNVKHNIVEVRRVS